MSGKFNGLSPGFPGLLLDSIDGTLCLGPLPPWTNRFDPLVGLVKPVLSASREDLANGPGGNSGLEVGSGVDEILDSDTV